MDEPGLRVTARARAIAVVLTVGAIAAGCAGSGASVSPAASTSAQPAASAPSDPTASPLVTTAPAPTARPSDGQAAGEIRTDPWGISQVWVPSGSFVMGTDAASIADLTAQDPPDWVVAEFPSEQPAHDVRLTHGYWIDATEVTVASFAAFGAAGGYLDGSLWSPAGRAWLASQDAARLPLHCQGDVADQPRMCITWFEAEAYATWRGGRLPTEAEWEYAARGPESRTYPWGDTWDIDRANVINSIGPKAVGSYPAGASWVGAQDMAGNAMEWVSDWLGTDYYATSPGTDPTGPATGTRKVEKGGWWGSNEFVARSAYRHYEDPPTYGDKHIGFRVVSQ